MMTKKYMSRYLKCQRRHQPVVSPNANNPTKKETNKNMIMTNKICIKLLQAKCISNDYKQCVYWIMANKIYATISQVSALA